MARVSLGIILPGDPECVQKPNVFVKILEIICCYGFCAAIVGGIVTLGLMFVWEDWELLFMVLRWFGVFVFLVFTGNFLWDEKHRCEYCHHFFTLKRISDNKYLGSTEKSISRTTYDSHDGFVIDSTGSSALYTSISSGREYGTEVTKEYSYNIRCRCCGAVCKVKQERTTQHY